MIEKPGRALILISCACAIFLPGAFIFGFPGIMRQHWQQAFNVGGSAVGQTVFFILAGATCFMYLCGCWQEKYGPRKLAALGAVLCGSSAFLPGRAENMAAVYAWAFLGGASSSFADGYLWKNHMMWVIITDHQQSFAMVFMQHWGQIYGMTLTTFCRIERIR